MEKRMKNISWASAVFLLSLLLVVSIGCDNTKSNETVGGGGGVGDVTLSMQSDTLRFLPGDSASTTITVIVSNQQGSVMPNQRVELALSNPQLGYIEFLDTELRDTTNQQGRVNLLFTAIGTAGDNTFTAKVGAVTTERKLVIRPQELLVGSITLSVTPDNIQAAIGNEAVADVMVIVSDNDHVAISNLSIPISCDKGRLAPLPATNDSGIARTKWFSNDEFGQAVITASAGDNEELTKRDTVIVTQLRNPNGTLTVTANPNWIRADGCISKSKITATLKDAFGVSVVGDTVFFGAPGLIGSIESIAMTNSVGQCTLSFCEQNIPNIEGDDSAMVVARYPQWGLADTVRLWVEEAEPVTYVNIAVGSVIGTVGDSIDIILDARYESGAPVQGHYAHFTKHPCGSFTADSMRIVNGNLESPVIYVMCKTIPSGVDIPWIMATVQGVNSNQIVLDPQPGPASRVVLETPLTAEVNAPITISAVVQDTFNNYVEDGQLVLFESDLGSIGSISQTQGGIATTNFNPGTQAGQAQIKAIAGNAVDSSVIVIGSDLANSIYLTVSEPSLEAAGTGGIEWTQLQATVLDANGNEVEDGTWVRFYILAAPPGSGVNINDHGELDSTQTANGTAVATLNAGNTPGPILIKACTDGLVIIDEVPTIVPICVQHGGIAIVAGPPANVFVYPNEMGIEGGGAAWDLEVSALVVDEQQNPVRCGVSVFFDVFPPSTAQILSRNVVTCNENMSGDSSDGVAYTVLRYLSPQTFNTITLTARTANDKSDEIQFELPLQGGVLDLNCAPGSWHFVQQDSPCRIQCTATVQDGHDVLIDGALVYFTSQRGLLYDNDQGAGLPISYATTLVDGNHGQAIVWLVSDDIYIFPSPDIPEISGEVNAEVVGYSIASDGQVINFRH